jgi:hypothetical protein
MSVNNNGGFISPLTPAHIDDLKNALTLIAQSRELLRRSKLAGMPVDDQLAKLDDQEKQINLILKHLT